MKLKWNNINQNFRFTNSTILTHFIHSVDKFNFHIPIFSNCSKISLLFTIPEAIRISSTLWSVCIVLIYSISSLVWKVVYVITNPQRLPEEGKLTPWRSPNWKPTVRPHLTPRDVYSKMRQKNSHHFNQVTLFPCNIFLLFNVKYFLYKSLCDRIKKLYQSRSPGEVNKLKLY